MSGGVSWSMGLGGREVRLAAVSLACMIGMADVSDEVMSKWLRMDV